VKQRRALTNVGGAIDTAGGRAEAEQLAAALAVTPASDAENDPARLHIHGFHTYPARMHPVTAARLVAAFSPAGGAVLDPFCGSGTVLVEARLAGRSAFGVDLNPLAVRLATCKTQPRASNELTALIERAADCATQADARRAAKAGATRRYPRQDIDLFEPHVLLELDSLRAAIEKLPMDSTRADLELVLSAILLKLSRKPGDTSANRAPKRTAGGFAARFFVEKTRELATRLNAAAQLLPNPPPPAVVRLDDATAMKTLPPGPVAAIITSPPYAATYDYLSHHDVRLRWLGLDPSRLARGEMGSRSRYERLKPGPALTLWREELERFCRTAARVLPSGGSLVVLMGDSAVGDVALRADEMVAAAGGVCGLLPVARASQPRPHFHTPTAKAFRARPRFEHALLLRKE
jgi:SAM-dependent methyltransferase